MRMLICITAVLLAGCGSWQRPNTNEAQFQQDSHQCEVEALQAYPPLVRGFGAFPDDSSASRRAYQTYCMKGLGYEWRTNSQLPKGGT